MTEEEKKAELLRQLANAEGQAEQLEKEVKDLGKGLRLVRDAVKPYVRLLKLAGGMPPGSLDSQLGTWTSWNSQAQQFGNFLNSVPMSAMNYGSVNSAMHSASFTIINQFNAPAMQQAMEELTKVVTKQELAAKAIDLLKKLDLDHRAPDRRSPVDLLNEAREAMERPATDDSVTSILIPLRESIEAAIAELIRRRPQQEEAKKTPAKIISIGQHCGKAGLASGHFERKGDEAAELLNKLSGTKQAGLDRIRLTSLYQQGLLLLVALLESVDGSKLKPA